MTTKLDAVNTILAGVGEARVLTLEPGFMTADNALHTLETVKRQVLERGWFFNTEQAFPLVPDSTGTIRLPENLLRFDGNLLQREKLATRGGRLYDLRNHTYTFDKTVKADIVVDLDYDDLPEAAKQYIMFRAKRLFQADFFGDANLYNMQNPDEKEARAYLEQMNTEGADYNIFDNYELAEDLSRDLL
jgi:hypothetical protein